MASKWMGFMKLIMDSLNFYLIDVTSHDYAWIYLNYMILT